MITKPSLLSHYQFLIFLSILFLYALLFLLTCHSVPMIHYEKPFFGNIHFIQSYIIVLCFKCYGSGFLAGLNSVYKYTLCSTLMIKIIVLCCGVSVEWTQDSLGGITSCY